MMRRMGSPDNGGWAAHAAGAARHQSTSYRRVTAWHFGVPVLADGRMQFEDPADQRVSPGNDAFPNP
jgi:hypothetical protein